jgi:hypothetical protein
MTRSPAVNLIVSIEAVLSPITMDLDEIFSLHDFAGAVEPHN